MSGKFKKHTEKRAYGKLQQKVRTEIDIINIFSNRCLLINESSEIVKATIDVPTGISKKYTSEILNLETVAKKYF